MGRFVRCGLGCALSFAVVVGACNQASSTTPDAATPQDATAATTDPLCGAYNDAASATPFARLCDGDAGTCAAPYECVEVTALTEDGPYRLEPRCFMRCTGNQDCPANCPCQGPCVHGYRNIPDGYCNCYGPSVP
jgi:hypothetical protein